MIDWQPRLFPDPFDPVWEVKVKDQPWLRPQATEEAKRRHAEHKRRKTVQTSKHGPRNLREEDIHLCGEAAMGVMLLERGFEDVSLEWGDSGLDARDRSRRGNVIPGILSVYVPVVDRGGLIIRQPEAFDTPDLIFVLVQARRRDTPEEYFKAIGWRLAKEGWLNGSNYGPSGKPLRTPGDRIVRTRPMTELLAAIRSSR
jgi:hypothetical protein